MLWKIRLSRWTKRGGVPSTRYYERIWADPDATAIKVADRISNVRGVHLKGPDKAARYLAETRREFGRVQHTSGLLDTLAHAVERAEAALDAG